MLLAVRGWSLEVEMLGVYLHLTRRMVHLRIGPDRPKGARELFYMAAAGPQDRAEYWCTLFGPRALAVPTASTGQTAVENCPTNLSHRSGTNP